MPSSRLPISVCIIAGAEAVRIRRVLASVAGWTSEIIVVINEEVADGTDRIAAEFGAKVFREPWKGHIAQKNSAADKAVQPWLLGLDADEEISPKLRAEITAALANATDQAAFSFPRCTTSSGRWIRHGDWYPDRKTRLWRRGQAQWGGVNPHDKLIVNGRVGRLRHDLLHYHEETTERQLDKLISYAETFARQAAEQGRHISKFDVVFRPVWRFLRCYFFRAGFLDGYPGFTIAWFGAFYTFLRYSRALELQQKRERRPAAALPGQRGHLLIYEPRIEGHHVDNLQHVVTDLLDAGHPLTLALDPRPEAQPRLRAGLGSLLERVKVIPARGKSDAEKIQFLSTALAETKADRVFLANFDEVASSLLRRAAFGRMPPRNLRGRLSGSYSRPRFLAGRWTLNQWLKATGFARLMRDGWIDRLLFPDPFIAAQLAAEYPGAVMTHIPSPVPENFSGDPAAARRELGIGADRKVFLFYGGGYRRKGLHLAVAAMQRLPATSPAFLLCAGELPDDEDVRRGLAQLTAAGRALALARYVNSEEEHRVFAAADFVLLPYIGHFGTSGVQSQAAGAGKPIIASDEGLVGRLARERGLGPVFPTGDVAAFAAVMDRTTQASAAELAGWRAAADRFAQDWSRKEFHRVMTGFFTD